VHLGDRQEISYPPLFRQGGLRIRPAGILTLAARLILGEVPWDAEKSGFLGANSLVLLFFLL
jgi:hypothetical protein